MRRFTRQMLLLLGLGGAAGLDTSSTRAAADTDVSNLDDLAAAIPNSPQLRSVHAYAVAQAAATQSEESEIVHLLEDVEMLKAKAGGGTITVPQPPAGTVYFYDNFETAYPDVPLANGMNPNAAPIVSGYGISDRESWGVINYGLANVHRATDPVYGEGAMRAITTGPGQITAGRWAYRPNAPGWRFYGMEWLFPSDWAAPDPANNSPTCNEIRYYPFVHGGGPCGLAPHDDVMKMYCLSGQSLGNVSGQPHDWSNGGGFKDVISSPDGANHYPVSGPSDWWIIPDGQMDKSKFHQVIVGVYWTAGPAWGQPYGHYLGYWKRRGESTWTKTVDVSGAFPTEWWGTGDNGLITVTPDDMFSGSMPEGHNYGIYRGSVAGTVYMGQIVETDTLALCQSYFT